MSAPFDVVVRRAMEACESLPAFAEHAERALLVRTTHGHIRLVLRVRDAASAGLADDVTAAVARSIGSWFNGPVILVGDHRQGHRQLAQHLMARATEALEREGWSARWPRGWPLLLDTPARDASDIERRWLAHQATLGKGPWLPSGEDAPTAVPPWPLAPGTPRITAFYGFKGGVGRTTTLGILAWRLAAAGRKVVCIDLDLESPGLARFLLRGEPPDSDGVLDELLAWAGTKEGLDGRLPVHHVEAHGVHFQVLAAGSLGPTWLEKLARLDTLHRGDERSPVHGALIDCLKRVKRDLQPDHILLDCRSGLHDLAGLALHDLAHVDVLVGRGDRQELDGLRVFLPSLLRRRKPEDRRLLVLRTFHRLPVDSDRLDRQREALHELFSEAGLWGDEEPGPGSRDIASDPCAIGFHDDIANASWLGDVDPATLNASTFGEALKRLTPHWESDP